jgi:galactose-1-phosphate uridylyltransferase
MADSIEDIYRQVNGEDMPVLVRNHLLALKSAFNLSQGDSLFKLLVSEHYLIDKLAQIITDIDAASEKSAQQIDLANEQLETVFARVRTDLQTSQDNFAEQLCNLLNQAPKEIAQQFASAVLNNTKQYEDNLKRTMENTMYDAVRQHAGKLKEATVEKYGWIKWALLGMAIMQAANLFIMWRITDHFKSLLH